MRAHGRSRAVGSAFVRPCVAALIALAGCDSGTGGGPGPDDSGCQHIDSAAGLELAAGDTQIYRQHSTQVQGAVVVDAAGRLAGIRARFLDTQGDPIFIADDCTINELRWEIADPAIATVEQSDPARRWEFDVVGVATGTTTLRVFLWHDNHSHFRSEAIQVTVNDPNG